MAVSLEKRVQNVKEQAPHLISLAKSTVSLSKARGLNPDENTAAVVATFDDSASAEPLYRSGEMQRVADMATAAAMVFDDDQTLPASFFASSVQPLGDITLSNSKGYLSRQRPRWQGTQYARALQWIIEEAGYSNVDLGAASTRGGFFGRRSGGTNLTVKATAKNPTFAIFITDGEPQDPDAATDLLLRMSQLPIFVQFVGVGSNNFRFLRKLDDLDGRLIDNAGFFDAKDASTDQEMLTGLLNEFPGYYQSARTAGLIG